MKSSRMSIVIKRQDSFVNKVIFMQTGEEVMLLVPPFRMVCDFNEEDAGDAFSKILAIADKIMENKRFINVNIAIDFTSNYMQVRVEATDHTFVDTTFNIDSIGDRGFDGLFIDGEYARYYTSKNMMTKDLAYIASVFTNIHEA